MARSAKNKPGARPRRRRSRRRPRAWLVHLGLIGLLAFAAGVLWTDHVVTTGFEGRRSTRSARVYARPLELYAGARVSQERMLGELELLGYRRTSAVSGPGEYSVAANAVEAFVRAFDFPDGRAPVRRVRLQFDGDIVRSLRDADTGEALAVQRLEPMEFAQIIPAHREDRILLGAGDIPDLLSSTLLAVEDRRFRSHPGFDVPGIVRAALANLRAGRVVQGASTLTQQLAKNLYLERDRSWARKLHELLMALILEFRFSKDEILQAYVNEIFLGQQGRRALHGFGLAARYYFNRPVAELDAAQIAMLVGLVRGPSLYDPRRHPERALERRNTVLAMMASAGVIPPARAQALAAAPLGLRIASGSPNAHPAFLDLVRRQLLGDYRDSDLREAGLRVFTSLDPWQQRAAERILAARLEALEKDTGLAGGVLQAAFVLLQPATGEVLALVGDRDPTFAGFNRALDARRPVGSLIKPALYLAALGETDRYTPLTLVDDTPLTLPDSHGRKWSPGNFDGSFMGPVTLAEAMILSRNVPAVRVGLQVGYRRFNQVLGALGLEREVPSVPSVFLGAVEMSPLEVAGMYATFASGGARMPARAVTAVVDSGGRRLDRYGLDAHQGVDQRLAWQVNYLMTGVTRLGTARRVAAVLPGAMPLAGKTGTTNDLRDSWFAGFGSDLLGVVWTGRDDNAPTRLTGSSGALRVWLDIMARLRPAPLRQPMPAGLRWQSLPVAAPGRRPACTALARVPLLDGTVPAVKDVCADRR